MATLQELMADFLGETDTNLSKQASATKTSSDEINQVLENLGINDSESVKTASESNDEQTGGNMGLRDIYEQIMGESQEGAEKVASEQSEPVVEQDSTSSEFGEVVGQYFNVMAEPFFDKVAGDLESEAGAGHSAMGDLDAQGAMGKTLGKQQDPHLSVNREMKNGKQLAVSGSKSPYSLKEKALLKAILQRSAAGEVGNIVE